ncbi:hypothetical protein [Rhodopirellula sp. MGV]|nr:hypothetical protein [Rhodopirellula sp. MGV]
MKNAHRLSQILVKAGIAIGFVTAVIIGLSPFVAAYCVMFGWPL